jgi:hypothetical protein
MSVDWYHYIDDIEKILEDTLSHYCLEQFRKRYAAEYLQKLKNAVNENSTNARVHDNNFYSDKSVLTKLTARNWLKAMIARWDTVFAEGLGAEAPQAKLDVGYLQYHSNQFHHKNKSAVSEEEARQFIGHALVLLKALGLKNGVTQIRQLQDKLSPPPKDAPPAMATPPPQKIPDDLEALLRQLEYQARDGNTNQQISLLSLKITTAQGQEQNVNLDQSVLTIGRGKQNRIVLDDSQVSSLHMVVVNAGSHGVLLMDMGSTNGTSLDGEQLPPKQPARWMVGKRVLLGNTLIELKWRLK